MNQEGKPVTWGLLSTARINELVLAGARESDRVQFVAVGSRDRDRAEAYAREHGIERAHGSYEALLQDPDVEAVYISLPNSMHVEWSVRAVEAGKHVLCEKPLDRRASIREDAGRDAAEQGGAVCGAFLDRGQLEREAEDRGDDLEPEPAARATARGAARLRPDA